MGELCCTILGIIVMILLIGALGWVTTLPEE